MSQRSGVKRSRSSGGRESDSYAPPKKLTRVEEEDSYERDTQPEFSFSQMHAQSQDELEAEQRTKEMKMVSGERSLGGGELCYSNNHMTDGPRLGQEYYLNAGV